MFLFLCYQFGREDREKFGKPGAKTEGLIGVGEKSVTFFQSMISFPITIVIVSRSVNSLKRGVKGKRL